jgi:FkbM family methyltransferase
MFLVSRLLLSISYFCQRLARLINQTPHDRLVSNFKNQTNPLILIDYPLGPDSIVVEVGGYRGQWTKGIIARFGCQIHVFEPISSFYKELIKKFKFNPKVHLYNWGLSNKKQRIILNEDNDASGIYSKGNLGVPVQFVKAANCFKKLKLNKIDLVNINIEGSEYDLLDHLIDVDFVKNIKYIQVQFHDVVKQSKAKRLSIIKKLSRTHKKLFSYPFVWESWELKN